MRTHITERNIPGVDRCRRKNAGAPPPRTRRCGASPTSPDSEVRKRSRVALANFGTDEDTSKSMFLVCFLDLKFARRLALKEANFKSSTLGPIDIQDSRRA
jgi:hypothetical protein